MSISIHYRQHSHHRPPFIISSTYEHFQIEFRAIGLFIEPQKCVTWSFVGLLPDFDTPSQFNTPSKGIRISVVPLNISSFKSSFIKNTLLKDVKHIDLFPTLSDVQVIFGILIHCYMQWPSYQLCCTPPFFTFIDSLVFFHFFLLQVFGHLLGPRSFDNLERSLAHKQASLPITLGGIGFILTL